MQTRRIRTWYLFGASVVLFVLGSILLWVAATAGLVLNLPDSIFPFPTRLVFYLSGSACLTLSVYSLVAGSRHAFMKLCLLAWFAASMCIYQIGSLWSGDANFLNSLGNLNDRIPIPPRVLFAFITAIFIGLFTGASLLIVLSRLELNKAHNVNLAMPSQIRT